ncbi:unnamed protein product [Cylicostephanus goldi]|uniref:Uncharacterized protein n=1 Tax=Cylicostephanus goldi TaxID=71465 RepID=A0A3P6TXD1_CYLGO|nr:unnamed protein product [Cylicostephanus goldi]
MADGPARVLGIYGGTCFLVYIETGGFTKAYSPMMFSLPLAALSFLSLTSSMQAKPRFVTAAAFGVLGKRSHTMNLGKKPQNSMLRQTLYLIRLINFTSLLVISLI